MFSLGQLLTTLVLVVFFGGIGLCIFCEGKKKHEVLATIGVAMVIIGLACFVVLSVAFAWFHLSQV